MNLYAINTMQYTAQSRLLPVYLVAPAETILYLDTSSVWGPRILLWSSRRRRASTMLHRPSRAAIGAIREVRPTMRRLDSGRVNHSIAQKRPRCAPIKVVSVRIFPSV